MGRVNEKTIALVGDLKHGRTVHSLAKLLCLFRDITIHYVAPVDELQIPQDIWDYVAERGVKQVPLEDEKFRVLIRLPYRSASRASRRVLRAWT